MLFLDFPCGLLLLLCGTDDGSLHFLKVSTSETVFSLFEVLSDPIVGMAANRLEGGKGSSSTEGDQKFVGERTRLLVCDCQLEAKLFDLSGIVNDCIRALPLLKSFEIHPGGTTTDVIAVDDIESFMCSSDTGEISVWSYEGELTAKFAQRKPWPIADPRISNRTPEEIEAFKREREEEEGSVNDSDASASDSDTDVSTRVSSARPSVSRHSSLHPRSVRRRAPPSPPRREVSFLDSHPMYVPRDECDKYIKDFQQQQAIDANGRAEKEKKEAAETNNSSTSNTKKGNTHGKVGLVDMLNKLETDLRHQSDRYHMSSSLSPPNVLNLSSLIDSASAALQGTHVYEKFHLHHNTTGASISSAHAHSALSINDPLGDNTEKTNNYTTTRTPRTRTNATTTTTQQEDTTTGTNEYQTSSSSSSSPPLSSYTLSTTATTTRPPRDRSSAVPPVRVSFSPGTRTISNSDIFVPPLRMRKTKR